MFRQLKELIRQGVVTFRFSILSIFSTMFLISVLLLIAITYYAFAATISYATFKMMQDASDSVNQKIIGQIEGAISLTKYSASLIQSNIIPYRDLDKMRDNLDNIISVGAKNISSVNSAIWVDEAGTFIVAHKFGDNGQRTIELINRYQKPVSRTIITQNLQGKTTSQVLTNNITVDQRTRPWYISTKQAMKPIVTDFFQYNYFDYKVQGIDVTAPVTNNKGELIGVLGLYMRIDRLQHLLEKISVSPNSVIFIATNSGEVLAYPHLNQYNKSLLNINQLKERWVAQSFAQYKKSADNQFTFNFDHKKYFAIYNSLGQFGTHTWLIAIVAPQSDFSEQLNKISFITTIISFFILLIGIVLITRVTTLITNSLKRLTVETEHIKNFELAGTITTSSRIKEIISLTAALNAMKKGLRSFQKYVPASLVRDIIETENDAQVGGEKKQLAIFFSDIKDFTSIAGQVEPTVLMSQICEYFDALTHIIIEEKGTVDKYIGDSIMAFWGAPLVVSNPCHMAASSALHCIKRLSELNNHWVSKGQYAFQTRIGLHLGESIVGNIGSSERMNYTAVGESINIASRLEGINKSYGTTIMVSREGYEAIKDSFVLRLVDEVVLKGTCDKKYVYELLAQNRSDLSFNIDQYQELFLKGFKAYQARSWDEAVRYFTECLHSHSSDSLAVVFIKRCQEFKKQPVSDEWDGAWHFQEK
jgi:adenylate cyclase